MKISQCVYVHVCACEQEPAFAVSEVSFTGNGIPTMSIFGQTKRVWPDRKMKIAAAYFHIDAACWFVSS